MSNEETNLAERPKTPAQRFRSDVSKYAHSLLSTWVGEDRAAQATGRISVALAASAQSSRNPSDFYECTKESVAKVIAISALTGIMPSTGGYALAYAIPRRPRRGEAPQLQYQLSHRGINALANRAGLHMIAIPIGYDDEIETTSTGEVRVVRIDLDNPPTSEAELRGVIIQVKRFESSSLLATGWVAKKLILARRDGSDSFSFAEKPGNEYAKDSDPWHKWFAEMAMKTAMHYAIGRGWCVIDDTESVKALSLDVSTDVIDGESSPARKLGGLVEPPKVEAVETIEEPTE